MSRIRSFMLRLSLLAAACIVLAVGPSAAQDAQQTQVLPDIAPRVVEIRGNLELSLPSLQRQPLVGFNPPPRVAPIPPERRPYVEDYKQESIDLPPSPLEAPQPPAVASLIGGTPANGNLEATAGRYLSRAVRFRSEFPLSGSAAATSRLDYDGARGHAPDAPIEDETASYDALDALVGVQTMTRWASVGLELDGFLNAYRLFGAQPSAGFPDLRDDPPSREGRGGAAALWLESRASAGADIDLRARYGVSTYETDALSGDADASPDPFRREEAVLDLESRVAVPLAPRRQLRGDVHFSGLGQDGEAAGSSVQTLDGAAGLHFGGGMLEITALGRLMSFSAGDSISHTYVAPDIAVDFYPVTGLRLYVINDARAAHHTTASLYRESPYLIDHPAVRPTVYTVDGRAGTRFQIGVFEADVHAGYSRAPNFLYYERAGAGEANGYGRGLIASRYSSAAVRYAGGDIAINFPAGFIVSTGVTFRDGTLTDSDEEIPYFGAVVGRGGLSYSFLSGRGFVEAVTTYESARQVDRTGSRRLGDYFDLDVEASYAVTDALSGVVRLQNLSSGFLERWEVQDQSPYVFSIGVRARW